jgi:hypothetical protein
MHTHRDLHTCVNKVTLFSLFSSAVGIFCTHIDDAAAADDGDECGVWLASDHGENINALFTRENRARDNDSLYARRNCLKIRRLINPLQPRVLIYATADICGAKIIFMNILLSFSVSFI